MVSLQAEPAVHQLLHPLDLSQVRLLRRLVAARNRFDFFGGFGIAAQQIRHTRQRLAQRLDSAVIRVLADGIPLGQRVYSFEISAVLLVGGACGLDQSSGFSQLGASDVDDVLKALFDRCLHDLDSAFDILDAYIDITDRCGEHFLVP